VGSDVLVLVIVRVARFSAAVSPVIARPAPAGRGDLINGIGLGPVEIATSLAGSLLATTERGEKQ
jgi:hypothetical protein